MEPKLHYSDFLNIGILQFTRKPERAPDKNSKAPAVGERQRYIRTFWITANYRLWTEQEP